jgi:hypothetical protein
LCILPKDKTWISESHIHMSMSFVNGKFAVIRDFFDACRVRC